MVSRNSCKTVFRTGSITGPGNDPRFVSMSGTITGTRNGSRTVSS